MKKLTYLLTALFLCLSLMSSCGNGLIPKGKAIYIPHEFDSIGFDNPACQYSYQRMAYTDDIVVFWDSAFGNDLSVAPDLNGHSMKVDLDKILTQTQRFYTYYRDMLKFIKEGSKADTFRMMVMVNYSEDGTAYGGAYDDFIGALWVTPVRLQDEKLNAVAHELGHSFQAQVGADTHAGLGGSPFWEMTSQWMLWQVNSLWMTDENYHWTAYMQKTNLALFHPSNMYHSPYMLEYWADKHGVEIIADVWYKGTWKEDPAMAYQRVTGISQDQFNAEVFEAAQKFITYDFDRVREVAKPYANRHFCETKALSGGWYQMADKRCLQNYGYDAIQLAVPAPGTKVNIAFHGMPHQAEGGWRYGLVAVDNSGEPLYGEMQTASDGTFSYVVPESGLSYLWLVVTGAPAEHSIDPQIEWPCRFKITGTTLVPVENVKF